MAPRSINRCWIELSLHHPTALSRTFLGQRVDPQIPIRSGIEGSVAELGHLGIQIGGHTRHLRIDPVDAHGADKIIQASGGHSTHRGLADHCHQGLLRPRRVAVRQHLARMASMAASTPV